MVFNIDNVFEPNIFIQILHNFIIWFLNSQVLYDV